MLKNLLLSVVRRYRSNKQYFILNILGLSLGLGCSILIFLWIFDEKQIDAFHPQQSYIVYERKIHDGKTDAAYNTPGVLGEELKKAFPEIRYAVNTSNSTSVFRANNKLLKETGKYGGSDFFKVFGYKILTGEKEKPLTESFSIVISKRMAEKLFKNTESAVGQTVRYDDNKDLIVTAVFDDVTKSSSEQFEFVINWDTYLQENEWSKDLNNTGPMTVVNLKKGTDASQLQKKLQNFYDPFVDQKQGLRRELGLQRFRDKYLYSEFTNGSVDTGRIKYLKIFAMIAFGILLIACINFMNLSTAYSLKRSREVGIRKAVGAGKNSLFLQFVGESVLFSVLSTFAAIYLVSMILPYFNSLTEKNITLPFADIYFWLLLLSIALVTGILAGVYPALFVSSFNPVKVLKGALKFDSRTILLRKGLVVFQFFLCISFIIGTIVIRKQIAFLQEKQLGYNRQQLLYVPLEGELSENFKLFKEQIKSDPAVKDVSLISQAPTRILSGTFRLEWKGKDPNYKPRFTWASVGYDFVRTMKLHLIEGRDFSEAVVADSASVIINETARKIIGYQQPIGATVRTGGGERTIIGVIKDFHFSSLHDEVAPLFLNLNSRQDRGAALIRIAGDKTKHALALIERSAKKNNPNFPFSYQFADDEYQKLYKTDFLINKLSVYFSFLAVVISCLGLIGLSVFAMSQRIREISIRKVLGAKATGLFLLLSKDFLMLILIAFVLAVPLSRYSMTAWLEGYAYRTEISVSVYILAGAISVVIALITISLQAAKVTFINPIANLRSDH